MPMSFEEFEQRGWVRRELALTRDARRKARIRRIGGVLLGALAILAVVTSIVAGTAGTQ